jgi:hypothetical protein
MNSKSRGGFNLFVRVNICGVVKSIIQDNKLSYFKKSMKVVHQG